MSMVALFIVVGSILVVSQVVGRVQLDNYADKPVKLYLLRASIGVVPVFLMASVLFFLFALLGG